ncbi:putative vesicle transport v-SNARE protein VTI1 [Triangularia setosa]|uniref:Vesicle transport v-SNARE protein VTI1 n=1 Tax=Triangularia setosa TaxID=2587417 RepID=A0AAN7ADG1_9PEZI|nr:putative vesicle transport v-SNARE protein VTI1 [Podospora setosa]
MSNPLDTDAGTELFKHYETEYQLVRADLTQKLDQINELSGEPRKAALSAAERALEETDELVGQMQMEKQNVPSSQRTAINRRIRDYKSDVDGYRRKLRTLAEDRSALFGGRYTDNPSGSSGDAQLEQRQQLLSGTDRLDRSTQRLKASQQLANETESIGANTLATLQQQRETIEHTTRVMYESEGYVDRSLKSIKGIARRMATNRIITIAIITVLVLLIFAVIFSKFK